MLNALNVRGCRIGSLAHHRDAILAGLDRIRRLLTKRPLVLSNGWMVASLTVAGMWR